VTGAVAKKTDSNGFESDAESRWADRRRKYVDKRAFGMQLVNRSDADIQNGGSVHNVDVSTGWIAKEESCDQYAISFVCPQD
jgi:hypothetical protein